MHTQSAVMLVKKTSVVGVMSLLGTSAWFPLSSH